MSLRTIVAGALAATLVLGATAGTAQAKPYPKSKGLGYHYGYHHHYHRRSYGVPLAAGLIGGLALGAMAAHAAETCGVADREYVDRHGNIYVRRGCR